MPNSVGQREISSLNLDPDGGDEIARARVAGAAFAFDNHTLLALLNRLEDGLLLFDREWRIIFANAEARRISRVAATDMNSKSHWELYPETVGTDLERVYRRAMEQGTTGHIDYFHPPFGIWYDVHVIPVPQGVAIHYRDVTARKQAEEVRDSIARQLNQVLGVTTDGIISVNREWTITYFNNSAVQVLGRDDLTGKNLWQEYPDAASSTFYENYRRCMEERVPTEFEAYYPAPLDRWLSLICRPSDDGMVVFFRDITESRRAEMVFRQQRELITFVQQAARTAFWNLDLATQKVTFDNGSYPVFGHAFASLQTAAEFSAIIHPDDRKETAANVARAIETGDLVVNEFRVIDREGKIIWVEARSQTATVRGEAVSLGGMAIDITERKMAEEALAASKERYRVLTELSPQFLWTGSPDGTITYANQGLLDYLGMSLEEIERGHWIEAYAPEDRSRARAAWAHSVATGEVYDIEARLIERSSGEQRWWWMRALPLRDEAGAITDWLGVSVDIHDRKTAADALHQKQLETERQRAELETLYKTAPIGLALFDPVDFRYLKLNDRQAEIVGLPQEEVLGRTLTEIAPIPGLNEMFQKVAEGEPIKNALIEGNVAARPDEHRYWNVSYFPVFGADGTVRAITAASLEITAQKKTELALIQSEKLAAVGRLASSISHEINNPLEAVTNLLYLIANDPNLPKDLTPLTDMAQSELARVCQIATQTLRFHRQAVRATMVTAEELVGAVLNLYRGRLANSGIKVEAAYRSDTPVLCLENDIRQVLNNLIANAIDAMRLGGRLVVRAHDATHFSAERPDGVRGIRIVIADTGHGMSADVVARVFEPFYTTKALNGTGLGLWISSGIIARHEGHIGIRSSQDSKRHGTVFSLFLPHVSEAAIEDATPLLEG